MVPRGGPMGKISGKVAVVTGASRGIGAAIARRLAADGAKVVVNYGKSRAAAEEVVADILKAGGEAVAVKSDVSNPAEIPGLFAAARQHFGWLDILVNNAAVMERRPIERVDAEQLQRIDERLRDAAAQIRRFFGAVVEQERSAAFGITRGACCNSRLE